MVTAKPMMKPIANMNQTLRFRVRTEPSFSPTGTIPMSVPARNRESPTMSMTPPRMNGQNSSPSGAMVKFNTRTITIIGRTDVRVSLNFLTKSIYEPPLSSMRVNRHIDNTSMILIAKV